MSRRIVLAPLQGAGLAVYVLLPLKRQAIV